MVWSKNHLTLLSLKRTCCLYGAGHSDFYGGKSISRAIGRGGGGEIVTFLGHEMATSKTSAIGAQKSRDFQCQPLPMALPLPSPAGLCPLAVSYLPHPGQSEFTSSL
jgi:hypothetical protein